eukprot:TRINITY_DN9128_c0_g1_i5.p1 TRINITY_DN9128_c0_g1~~TRINITY_DN9128_c0_g1_i5.p1  ORF type:complete len:154 (+),score=42.09 TRINITY_DN9128_c0_g1_i5:381-842(+)
MKHLADKWEEGAHESVVKMVADDILHLNPYAKHDQILGYKYKELSFNEDGTLHRWSVDGCNISQLPDSFRVLRTTGDLHVSNNKLSSLPGWFGELQVGGSMDLFGNQIASLGDGFANIQVHGELRLKRYNKDMGPALSKAPSSFPNVGGKVFR